MGNIVLTGDRPTGRLHLGHFVGSLLQRINLLFEKDTEHMYVLIADMQALTDNIDNPQKVKDNVIEVALDYISVGLDVLSNNKLSFVLQSQVPALCELTQLLTNYVSINDLTRNPTIKSEIQQRKFEESTPLGFFMYPVSQAADILGFNTDIVPAGEDQKPMIELTRRIVRKINKDEVIFKEPEILLPQNKIAGRLPGIDGHEKMSKSLGNCIYLSDNPKELWEKIKKMYTDPNHLKISDPGNVEGNVVFTYLNAIQDFVKFDFTKIFPALKDIDSLYKLEEAYKKGGIGDMSCKALLFNGLNNFLLNVREKREKAVEDKQKIIDKIISDSKTANEIVSKNVNLLKDKLKLTYI